MTGWTGDELNKIGTVEEVQISSVSQKPVTIWVVRHGDDLYVRSVNGRTGRWFRRVERTHKGRIRAGRTEKDVTLVDAKDRLDEIDAAYRAKYRRYAGPILNSVLTPKARSATLRLVPQSRS